MTPVILACPTCRTLFTLEGMRDRRVTIASYSVLRTAQFLYPGGARIHLETLADACYMTVPALLKHMRRLVSVGLAVRVPIDRRRGWYYVLDTREPEHAEHGERRTDASVSGEAGAGDDLTVAPSKSNNNRTPVRVEW